MHISCYLYIPEVVYGSPVKKYIDKKEYREYNSEMKKADAKYITVPLIKWLDANNKDKVITTEIAINTSYGVKVADVVISNGHLIAYEVKSELDNIDRLEEQIKGYSEVFDYVYVVFWANKFKLGELRLPDNVGAIEVFHSEKNKVTFKKVKKAYKNTLLDVKRVANMLWKDELFYYLDKKSVIAKKSFDKSKLCELFERNYTKRESISILKDVFKGRFNKGFQAFMNASKKEDPLKALRKNKKDMNYLAV